MTRIVFLDTETTSLRADRRAWEVGLIVRDPGGHEEELHWFVQSEDLDLGNADPFALKVGRFYERHPDYARQREGAVHPEEYVLRKVELWTRGAILIGAVPGFDAEALSTRMRAHGILPSWNYRLRDIGSMAWAWLQAHHLPHHLDTPPVDAGTDDFARAMGIDPEGFERHTALGDCRLVDAMLRVIEGGGAS